MNDTNQAHKPVEPSATARTAKSKGEKFFDRAVYGGIAGVGTFVATIFITYLLKYGSWKGFHNGLARAIEKGLTKIKPGVAHAASAEEIAMTTTLMMGGNLMLLPVGIAEHHKVALVSGLNTAMDDPTPKEAIQHAPKQTWDSLIKSRIVAWLAVFAAFKGAGMAFSQTMQSSENETGKLLCKLTGKPATRLVKGIEQETKTFIFGKIGALDVFATIGSAILLYLGGHFFARKQEEKKERRAASHHTGAAPTRDVTVGEMEPLQQNAPQMQVAGTKLHEGTAHEAVLEPQR